MADREVLHQLLRKWTESRARGLTLSATEICTDRPDLIGPLANCIAQLQNVEISIEQRSTAIGITTDFTSTPTPAECGEPASQSLLTLSPASKGREQTTFELTGSFAGFRLQGILGMGAFGTVYRADDIKLHRKVAIKVMHEAALTRVGARESFLAEARALASVQNDHVVQVFQIGEEKGRHFLVMPLLAGETLASRLERVGALPFADVRRIGREIAAGLSAIHGKGLIHRDLKPANIWLEADTHRVKVLDLGLAQDPQTSSEMIAGTPAYMSPEQIEGRELDFRSDLFSLGTVLYECATGRSPFAKPTVADILRAIREKPPLALSKANPAISSQFSNVIENLLQKNPGERPDSAQTLLSLLDQLATQPAPTTIGMSSFRWPLFAGAGLVSLMIGFLIWWSTFANPDSLSENSPSKSTSINDRSNENTPEKSIDPVTIGPPGIADFDITHFARVEDGSKVEIRGIFGKTTWTAKQKDFVTLNLKLTRPAYTYLLAFRPDGVMELCYPAEENIIPPISAEASYPYESASRTKGYGLSESAGLWVFTAIVSESPLPAFQEWKQSHQLPTPKNSQGLNGVVLVDDGQSIDQLRAAGAQRGTRGKGEEIPGQRAIGTINDAIKQAAPNAALRSIGIMATPSN